MDSSTETEARAQQELQVLYRISQAMAHQHDVRDLFDEVLGIMETQMGLSRGTLTLRHPDADVFVIQASRGISETERQRGQYKLGEGVTGAVAKSGKPALIPDVALDKQFLDRTRSRQSKRIAFICVPIVHLGRVIGTISIDRPNDVRSRAQTRYAFSPVGGGSAGRNGAAHAAGS